MYNKQEYKIVFHGTVVELFVHQNYYSEYFWFLGVCMFCGYVCAYIHVCMCEWVEHVQKNKLFFSFVLLLETIALLNSSKIFQITQMAYPGPLLLCNICYAH